MAPAGPPSALPASRSAWSRCQERAPGDSCVWWKRSTAHVSRIPAITPTTPPLRFGYTQSQCLSTLRSSTRSRAPLLGTFVTVHADREFRHLRHALTRSRTSRGFVLHRRTNLWRMAPSRSIRKRLTATCTVGSLNAARSERATAMRSGAVTVTTAPAGPGGDGPRRQGLGPGWLPRRRRPVGGRQGGFGGRRGWALPGGGGRGMGLGRAPAIGPGPGSVAIGQDLGPGRPERPGRFRAGGVHLHQTRRPGGHRRGPTGRRPGPALRPERHR